MADSKGKNGFSGNMDAMFKGLDQFLTTKTVVGQPVTIGDKIMVPLADVSFGVGAGAFTGNTRDNAGGGMGAKMSPAAVLMIFPDGNTKLVSLKGQDGLAKLIDMAPGIISKVREQFGGGAAVPDNDIPDMPDFEENSFEEN